MQRLFGTDGIRGVANKFPMTADIALRFAVAAGTYYKLKGHVNRVIIAKDTRLSGYLLESALMSGFLSVGTDVILVGPMPTPAVAMLIRSLRADFGVMISASHNPYHDNGLKLFDRNGYKLSDTCEDNIQKMILEAEHSGYLVAPDLIGKAKRLDDAPGRYIEHVKRSFNNGKSLAGLRVVVDCANGAAYHLAPTIFWELGAELISINTEPNGFNINDKCGSTHTEALVSKVLETRADIGIALDGDADRCVICTEKGEIVDGDKLLAIIAVYLKQKGQLKNNTLVVTEMSNGALDQFMQKNDIKVVRTAVGDRNVFMKMQELGANLGGEQSGHIILGDFSTTGDGIVAALQMLGIIMEENKKMSKLANIFELYPQILRNIKFYGINPLDNPALQNELKQAIEHNPKEKIFIRKSGTEPLIRLMVEGASKAEIEDLAYNLESTITKYCA